MNYRVNFVMGLTAGHVTNYHNLRSVVERDSEIDARWCEVSFYRSGGGIEKLRERVFPFVPSYFSGVGRGVFEMSRGLREEPYDVIFTNASVSIFFSRTFKRFPTMLDMDSTPLQLDRMASYTPQRDPKPLESLKFQLFRNMLSSVTLLHVWSHWVKQSLIEDYGIGEQKIVVNPPGVNLNYWKPDRSRQDQASAHPIRILFVGGDFRRKGGEYLLEWYRHQDPSRYELHIVTREPVESRPGVTVYHNMQPNTPELLALYQQSDIFVLPSLGECFGIATVEAMAAGMPVIASDVGGTADIIEPGRNGYIIPAGSPDALGQAITAIGSDPVGIQRMGVQSRQLAEERFNLEVNVRKTTTYLKQISRMPAGSSLHYADANMR